MRIREFRLVDVAGIDRVEADGFSDVVVFAGPNGVGKTRMLAALIGFFRKPKPSENINMIIEATSEAERKAWGKQLLNTKDDSDSKLLRATLQKTQRRNNYRSTVLNFDSDRSITRVEPFNFSWDIPDPYEEDVGWDISYSFLRDRFQDVQHSLFRLVESQRRKIADKADKLMLAGETSMKLDYPDPLLKFKEAFLKLLAPKKMIGPDLRNQRILYEYEGNQLALETLSSGEREVVNIVFDCILRNPSDCIVFFDEPELHLHPELSYKLLQTLSSVGKNNQFIFCTHSPEIISASIENSVVFIAPKRPDKSNQALMIARDDSTFSALNLLGQSVGIISLGKKLLLIEGDESSLDKQTYGAILQNEFPELVLVPVGGRTTIQSFEAVRESVLNRTIWGVEFFMLCDRDAMNEIGPESVAGHLSDRLRILPRYHLENYFLEERVLAAVFEDMEPANSPLSDPAEVAAKIRLFAAQTVPLAVVLSVAAAARESVGNVDIMPDGINQNTTLEDLLSALDRKYDRRRREYPEAWT